jgi:cytochrome c5
MTNTTNAQDLGERIERLVQEHISATRLAAQAALDRAFARAAVAVEAKPSRQSASSRRFERRPSTEIAALGERLYEAVCKAPGETMMVLAPAVGASARKLHRPMMQLKRAGRVRCVGTRSAARYFPVAQRGSA